MLISSNPSFTALEVLPKLLYASGDVYVFGIAGNGVFQVQDATAFVYVQHGSVTYNSDWTMRAKQYGCFTWGWLSYSSDALGFIVLVTSGYRGMRSVGGELEGTGRLKYIDGCTDSLLIPPVKRGDPCLNHLHFPSKITQSPHTHPDLRLGMIARGRGECVTPFGDVPLFAGTLFVIHPKNETTAEGLDGQQHLVGVHSFRTTDSTMDVVAFHPSSDYGPTDEEHPMILQTQLLPKDAG